MYLTEGFGDVSFHLPVHCPPHSEAVVVGLGRNVLPHWIPSETFHQTSVSSQTCHHFWKNKAGELTEFSFRTKSKRQWNVLNPEPRLSRIVPQRKVARCRVPGNLRAFQMTMVLSTLQEASQTSWGDHDTSITSVNNKMSVTSLCFCNCSFFVGASPPVWFLRIVTHLHCSTLASLLLDPNTVLGPINLQKGGHSWLKCFLSVWQWFWFTVKDMQV